MKQYAFLPALLLVIVLMGGGCSADTETDYPETNDPFIEDLYSEQKNNQSSESDQPSMDQPTSDVDAAQVESVVLKTTKGDITVELFYDKSPKTVENFIKLASEGFYDGTRFHRVIKDFMIQGGDPLSKDPSQASLWGTGGPNYTFADEFNDVKLVKGSLAMANSGPNTNGSQFFIVTLDATPWLDGKHTNFGRVVEGIEVVDAIEGVQTAPGDRPLEDMIIESVVVNTK